MDAAHINGLLVIAVVYLSVLVIGLMTAGGPTGCIVFHNLDRAAEGRQFEPDGPLYGMAPDEIAYDLVTYAADCEGYRPEDLTPYVREWLHRTGRGTNEHQRVCRA